MIVKKEAWFRFPNATETMAERAWRYGEAGLPHYLVGGICFFSDGSALRRSGVATARAIRHQWDAVEREFGVRL